MPPVPQVITLSQLGNGGAGEAVEGRLIRVDGVTITSGSFPASGATGNVTITDSTGAALMRIDSDTNIDGTPTTAGTFSVIALASQFASTSPFDGGYRDPAPLARGPHWLGHVVAGRGPVRFGLWRRHPEERFDFDRHRDQCRFVARHIDAALWHRRPRRVGAYAVGFPGTTALGVGEATTVSVTFVPVTAGAKSAALTISTTGGGADGAVVPLPALALGSAAIRWRLSWSASSDSAARTAPTTSSSSSTTRARRRSTPAGTVSTGRTAPARHRLAPPSRRVEQFRHTVTTCW